MVLMIEKEILRKRSLRALVCTTLARLSSLPEAVRGKAHPTRAIVIFNLYYYLPNERHHKCLPNERHIYCCPMIRHCHDLIANLFPDHCSTLNKPESFQGVFRCPLKILKL